MKGLSERSNQSREFPSPRLSQRTSFSYQLRPSSHFRGQFESALQDYERQTGSNLIDHPLAKRLQACHTVEDIVDVLREQAQGIDDLHGVNYDDGDGRLMKLLNGVVYVLHRVSNSTVLGEVTNLVRQRMQMGVSCL